MVRYRCWVLMLLLLAACAPEESTAPARAFSLPTNAPTQTPLPSATPRLTPVAQETPQDADSVVNTIKRALQAADAQALMSLLTDEVFVARAPNGNELQTLSRTAVVQWLNARWGASRQVVSSRYVEHFVLLEVGTSGWAKVAPLERGEITLHLHRFAADGRADPLRCSWRIDTILYQ